MDPASEAAGSATATADTIVSRAARRRATGRAGVVPGGLMS